jgi:hypothetical protein
VEMGRISVPGQTPWGEVSETPSQLISQVWRYASIISSYMENR